MAAPIGNRFYELVEMPGRPKKYTPKSLWEKAQEYFQWVHENPLMETKMFSFQGDTVTGEVPKMRAMTENAFCLFACISHDTFGRYKAGKEDEYKDFCVVANTISHVIYQQKFEGAAADFLNANIIARDLGLKERTETEVKGVEAIRVIWDENV